jgi:hypothetical protein
MSSSDDSDRGNVTGAAPIRVAAGGALHLHDASVTLPFSSRTADVDSGAGADPTSTLGRPSDAFAVTATVALSAAAPPGGGGSLPSPLL